MPSSNSLGDLHAKTILTHKTTRLHVANTPDGGGANNSRVRSINLNRRVERQRPVRHGDGFELGLEVAGAEAVGAGAGLGDGLEAAGVAAAAVLEGEVLGLVANVDLAGEVAVRHVPVAVLAGLGVRVGDVEQVDLVDVDGARGGARVGGAVLVRDQAAGGADGDGARGERGVVVDKDR